jgi:hypothetical protein
LIGSTRLFQVKNAKAQALIKISEIKLRIVSEAMDKLSEWSLNTLARLKTNSNTLLLWLKSCRPDDPNRRPFGLPQEPTTVKRYVNLWKQFLFYVLRTSLLDEVTRDQVYGIRFTEEQLMILQQLLEMLNAYNGQGQDKHQSNDEEDEEDDDDFHLYDPDEDDEEEEEEEEEITYEPCSIHDDDDDMGIDEEEYSPSLTQVTEKLMQLSIAFITQYFPEGDDLHSPLVHFADVMGISNRTGEFNEAYNYTSYVAGLI